MRLNLKARILTLALAGVLCACNSFKDDETPGTFVEVNKDLSGVWQLTKVSRNNIDITSTMDFSQFKLHLNKDNTYSIENYLPFPVGDKGKWTTDDASHPFAIMFTEDDSADPVLVEIAYPVVDGKRQMSITHSPGCPDNKYKYLLIKVDDQK